MKNYSTETKTRLRVFSRQAIEIIQHDLRGVAPLDYAAFIRHVDTRPRWQVHLRSFISRMVPLTFGWHRLRLYRALSMAALAIVVGTALLVLTLNSPQYAASALVDAVLESSGYFSDQPLYEFETLLATF